MNFAIKRQHLLKILLMTCMISTAIHFTDNYLYIENYPQPDWITSASIYLLWIILTAIGAIGDWLYTKQRFWLSYSCLVIYSFCGLDSLGHYLYGSLAEFSPKMHIFIVMDGCTGLAVLGFILWSSLILREPVRDPNTRNEG